MSDHANDELASAYLDDEVTAGERARVEGDAALLARVEELRAARAALAAPVAGASAAAKDAAIRAAVDSMAAPGATVVDLRAARARRFMVVGSVAAGVLLLVGLAGVLVALAGSSGSHKSSTAAASLPTTTVVGTAAAGGTGGGAADSVLTAPLQLGSFTDRSALVAAALDASTFGNTKEASPRAAAPASGEGFAACSGPPPPDATAALESSAIASLDERPVLVAVYRLADGTHEVIVTDEQSCSLVFTQRV